MHCNLGSVYSVVFSTLGAESPWIREMYSEDLNSELLIVHYQIIGYSDHGIGHLNNEQVKDHYSDPQCSSLSLTHTHVQAFSN